MKKLFLILLITSISNNLLSQSVIATVYSGSHLILATDWSRFSNKNILVEKVDGSKRKIYNYSNERAINPTAMYVEGIDNDFEQGSSVKVYVLKAKSTEILSTPIQATVNSGSHLEKATDWSIYSGRNILVEEINGMNQNIYKTATSWNYNPNAMAVPTLENDYPQGTNVNVYIIEDLNFLNNNVGIGTNLPAYKLDVCGTIRAKEIKVDLQGGCDFVFEKDYKLLDLNELESFVTTHKHLPQIDSEKTMIENGLNMKDFQLKLLQKIEELTLYTIQQNKEITSLKKKVNSLESKNKKKRL